jgi:hypothetical protein
MEVTLNRKAFIIATAKKPWYYSIDLTHNYPVYGVVASWPEVASLSEAPPVIYYIDQRDRISQLPASENPDIIKHRSDAATRVYNKMIIGDLSNQIDQFFFRSGFKDFREEQRMYK